MRMRSTHILLGLLMLISWACAPKPHVPEPHLPEPEMRATDLQRLDKTNYPPFADHLNYDQLGAAIEKSLHYLRKLPPQRPVQFGPDTYTTAHLILSLEAFSSITQDSPTPETLQRRITERFAVYRSVGRDESASVLFTGYYEPLLEGRKKKSAAFAVPIHSRPTDLVEIDLSPFASDLSGRRIVGRYKDRTVVPYPDSEHIRQQTNFDGIAPPIAWLRDEIDLFNLMVQGSGKVVLDDGQVLQIGFDSSNGHPYRSIGRMLIEQGHISAERMSMQAIREYLIRHPAQVRQIMNHNPRYIFFRQIPNGPVGALGVPLTPRRSLAVDRGVFPSAALAFISVPLPQVDEKGFIRKWAPFTGFGLAQDAGSAITGPGRVDLFWGSGVQAEVAAGHLKNVGQLYFLVLDSPAASVP